MKTNAMNLLNELNATGLVFTKTLEMTAALSKYLDAIRADYSKNNQDRNKLNDIQLQVQTEMTETFNKGLSVEEGKAYYKIVTRSGSSRSVHSFIVKENGPKFKRGDILKAASWNAPAKNQARGNIFGAYKTLWTGAWYLR